MILNSREIQSCVNWTVFLILLTFLAVKLPIYLVTTETLAHSYFKDRSGDPNFKVQNNARTEPENDVSYWFWCIPPQGLCEMYIPGKVTLKSKFEKIAITVSVAGGCRSYSVRKPGLHLLPSNPGPWIHSDNHTEGFSDPHSVSIFMVSKDQALCRERNLPSPDYG